LNGKDLIEALAKDLPAGAIRFGCRIAAVHEDPGGHGAVLTMADGTTMKAKVIMRQLSDLIPNPKIRSHPRDANLQSLCLKLPCQKCRS
jgi:phytoene dehydrogenase-like protein